MYNVLDYYLNAQFLPCKHASANMQFYRAESKNRKSPLQAKPLVFLIFFDFKMSTKSNIDNEFSCVSFGEFT